MYELEIIDEPEVQVKILTWDQALKENYLGYIDGLDRIGINIADTNEFRMIYVDINSKNGIIVFKITGVKFGLRTKIEDLKKNDIAIYSFDSEAEMKSWLKK